jgi:MOSC domain-containing protein YiiM
MPAHVVSLNVMHAIIPDVGGEVGVTAIDKRPVSDARQVTTAGVAGDQRADKPNHGMPEQAVYAYALEDYQWWEAELGLDISAGKFGENLTTRHRCHKRRDWSNLANRHNFVASYRAANSMWHVCALDGNRQVG